MKHIYKIAKDILQKTQCPATLIIGKNTYNLCKSINKAYHNEYKHCDWTPESIYKHYRYNFGQYDYESKRIPLYFTAKPNNKKRMTLHGACGKPVNTIFLSRELKYQTKKYIKYVVLHEVGHWFNGPDEADADKFAEEWIDKI